MQIFRAFIKILKRNFMVISIYVVLFLTLCFTFSKVLQTDKEENFSQTELSIFVDNKDEGNLGNALIEYLDQNNEILPIPQDEDRLLDHIYNREVDYVLYIPSDFSTQFVSGERKDILTSKKIPSTYSSMLADSQINQYLTTMAMYHESGFSMEESIEESRKDMQLSITASIIGDKKEIGTHPASFYFQYIPYVFLSIMILSIGTILMAFQRKEIKERNRCSSIPSTIQTIQILLGCFILSAGVFIIFAVFACIFYPDYMFGWKGVLSLCNMAIFLGVSLVIACLVGHLSKNSNVISMMGNVIGLSLSFLGGVFVSLSIVDESILTLAKFTPTYWYITANEAIQKVSTFHDISPDIYLGFLVQGGFILAILSVVMLVNKKM